MRISKSDRHLVTAAPLLKGSRRGIPKYIISERRYKKLKYCGDAGVGWGERLCVSLLNFVDFVNVSTLKDVFYDYTKRKYRRQSSFTL